MRLINADEIEYERHWGLGLGIDYGIHDKGYWDVTTKEKIDKLPTIEIIRCKDCIYHEDKEPGMVYCPNIVGGWVDEDFYCRDGKR